MLLEAVVCLVVVLLVGYLVGHRLMLNARVNLLSKFSALTGIRFGSLGKINERYTKN